MRKQRLLLCWLALLPGLCTMAQSYPGYRTSNYTGVNGVFFNPANIADNRFKWDINVLAVDGFAGNDQAGLRFKDIVHSFSVDSLKSKLLRGNDKINSLSYADILGPSFMISLSPRTSLAISTRTRAFANGRDVNGNLAAAVIDASHSGITGPLSFNSNNSIVHATGWTEFGASVGQVFTNRNSHHFLKGGITLKYLAGTADSYLRMSGITGTIGNGAGTTFIEGPASGALSINTTNTNFEDYKIGDFFKFNGSGFGGDIGLVYEWRPPADYSMYETDRFANKYKLKIGLALLDVGRIRFKKSSNQAASYSVDIPAGDRFDLSSLEGKSVSEYKAVLDASPYFTGMAENNAYSVDLPTTLQANVDWLIAGGFGLNFGAQVSTNKSKDFKLYEFNSYSLTPRWENSLFGVELPLNYNERTQFNAGIGFRIGPLFFGSGSILTALVHDSKQADLYAGLHFGIPYKKKIKPDTDKDGIYDDVDKCPTVAGLPRYQGCPIPDTDGDGINDEEDSCVSVPGIARYHGCPIPDSDKDGVNDEEDSCVNVAGLPQFHGCPDTDGDGIPDPEDKCPTVAGVAKYQGCPVPDTDGDGVNDEEDLCPNQPGPASSRGCPVEQVAVQITAEFRNILFDFGKSTIRPESMDIIEHAAKTMNEQIPNSNFYIDGYTDNIGSVARNKKLSKARAQAVANALIKAGVDKSRVVARGFGKDNPKCDNKTEEGRQCNRRVEVVIRNINQQKTKQGVKLQ
jgi:outer membrane protein OmpA-like peptidoglycan-associated protein